MADEFDPYYTWLGIRPEEQPPDHYRLIGVRQFEENADVIANAMDQRMQFLRSMQVGKRSALSQRLLNEISSAGGCLLDPKRKQAYDKDLRPKTSKSRSEPQKAAPLPAAATASRPLPKAAAGPIPLPAPAKPAPQQLPSVSTSVFAETGSSAYDAKPKRGGNPWKLPLVLGGAVVGGIVLGVAALVTSKMMSSSSSDVATAPVTSPAKPASAKGSHVNPAGVKPSEEPKTSPKSAEKSPKATSAPPPPATTPKGVETPSSSQAWWSDERQLNGLAALEISEKAQAEFPRSASRSALANPVTAETWVRLQLENDKPVQILGTRLGHSAGGFLPKGWALLARKLILGETKKDQLILEIWNTAGTCAYVAISLPKPEEWHHIALTYEPAKGARLFVDGKKQFDMPAEKDLAASNRNIGVGSDMQPDGAKFKAEFCGIRVSEGIRYSKTFSPPSPLEMKRDDSTFALLDCALQAVQAPANADPKQRLAERGTKWTALGTGMSVARAESPDTVASAEPSRPSGSENTTPAPLVNPAPFVPPPPSAKKAAVPTAAEITQGKSQVTAVFGDDIKNAKTPKAKQDLAAKILDVVKDTNEKPSRYALLHEARRLAVEAKDIALGMTIVERLNTEFEIDLLAQKIKLLESLAGEALPTQQRSEVLSAACTLGSETIDEGKFTEAEAIAAVARGLAVKSITPEARAESKEFFETFLQRKKQFEIVRKAEQTLAKSADDPAANLVAGLYHCFGRKDPQKGLPMLAKGSDPKLAAAAKARQQNIAKGVQATLEEADAWHDAISSVPADYKSDVQRLALAGYTFLASSGTGLEKVKAEKRRDELAGVVPAATEKSTAKKPKKTDLPETSAGMVGRVLIDGKDAGYLLTHQPPREMEFSKLSDILMQTKARGGRIILEGVLSLPTPTTLVVFHQGRDGGPEQLLSLDGKEISAAGGSVGRGRSVNLQLPAGDHLVQWVCDFDGSNTPRVDFYSDTGGNLRPLRLQFTREQNYAARKFPTKTELSLSN